MIDTELTARFHPTLVRKNQSGQDYVPIDGYINRLNEVLGHAWAWHINDWKFYPDAAPQTSTGKNQYMAIVQGTLTVLLSDVGVISTGDGEEGILTSASARISRDGIGAGVNFDPDTAVKTAQAEALKKACHQFGIALYLWSEAERDFIALQKRAAGDDAALKQLIMAYTQRELEVDTGVVPDADQMLKVLGLKEWDLDKAREILTKRGIV